MKINKNILYLIVGFFLFCLLHNPIQYKFIELYNPTAEVCLQYHGIYVGLEDNYLSQSSIKPISPSELATKKLAFLSSDSMHRRLFILPKELINQIEVHQKYIFIFKKDKYGDNYIVGVGNKC